MDYLVVKNLDIAVIVIYFMAVIGNGIYWSRKAKQSNDFCWGENLLAYSRPSVHRGQL